MIASAINIARISVIGWSRLDHARRMFQHERACSLQRSLEPEASKTDRRMVRHSLDSVSIKKRDQRCHVTKLWIRILSYVWILAVFWIALRAMFTVDPSKGVKISATSRQRPNLLSLPPSQKPPLSQQVPKDIQTMTCAIILFGLPRAFRHLVLPSLEQNVIKSTHHDMVATTMCIGSEIYMSCLRALGWAVFSTIPPLFL